LLARPWALQEEEHHGRERQRRGCKHHGRQACRQRPARNADDILSTRAGRGLVRAARRAWHAWHARQSARTTCRPPGEPARAEPSRPPARHRQWRPCCKRVALVTRACSGARGQQTADSRQCSPTGQARGRGAPVAAVPGEQHNPADAERGRRQRAAAAAPAHEALEQHGARARGTRALLHRGAAGRCACRGTGRTRACGAAAHARGDAEHRLHRSLRRLFFPCSAARRQRGGFVVARTVPRTISRVSTHRLVVVAMAKPVAEMSLDEAQAAVCMAGARLRIRGAARRRGAPVARCARAASGDAAVAKRPV